MRMVKLLLQKIRSIRINPVWGGIIIGIVATHLIWFAIFFIDMKVGSNVDKPQEQTYSLQSPSPSPLPVVIGSPQIAWMTPVSFARLNVFKTQKEVDTLLAESYGGPPDLSKFYFVKVAYLWDGSDLVRGYIPKDYYYGVEYINFLVKDGSVKAAVLDGVSFQKDVATEILSPDIPVEYGKIGDFKIPETIEVGGKEYYTPSLDYPNFEEFDKLVSPVKFADTASGPMYVTYARTVAPTPLFDRIFYLKLNDGTTLRYSVGNKSTRYDNNVQKFTWSDGSANDIAFTSSPFRGGCGGGSDSSTQLVKASDLDSLQKDVVGIDAKGDPVYKLTDPASAVLKAIYKEYSDTHSSNLGETVVTYEEFLQDKNNILIKDVFNDWVFYLNPKYGSLAECGKPVIYLYPTQKENVNIQVGAKITQSDPSYTSNGWNVVASPDGSLIYNGVSYPYLFWEGLGNGIYPDVNGRGTVVKKEDVEHQLRQDLYKQGLNEKETSDFLDYWLPKMPNKPYVKLTWLNTAEMNVLAPLTVTPKPDTVIRVFLDFEGLDQLVQLEPQQIIAPQRNGFTLVEWGGLLTK